MKYNKSNYQDFLKTLAIIAMIVDHIGLFLFPHINILRIIGRFAMPVFCFFAGYNFNGRVHIRILLYGLLLYISSYFYLYGETFGIANILISIFIGQLYLKLFENQLKNFWFAIGSVIIMGGLYFVTYDIFDYGTLAISVMIIGYLMKYEHDTKLMLTISVSLLSYFHTFFLFTQFTKTDQIISAIVQLLLVILLNIRDYKSPIRTNLQIVARQSMLICVFHLIIIHIIWRYYIIG